jgi:hypothetical protein
MADNAVHRSLYRHTPFLVIVALYVTAGYLILRLNDLPIPYTLADTYQWPVALTITYLLTTFFIAVGRDVFVGRRRPGSRDTWEYVIGRWLGKRRLVRTLLVLASLPALLAIMYAFRLSLTSFEAFRLDDFFMKADLLLHAGSHPWELLQPIVGHPGVTRLIDSFYVYGWFAALWLGVIWQTVHGREPVRSQFLLTFALAWIILGTGMAIVMSSAGPVYYGRVTGLADPYQPLMTYLYSVDAQSPLRAIANQERLWASYTEWGGITAMPSMHLSIVTAVILAGVRTHRWRLYGLVPFGAIILVGSVHLGWHYAVDSYVGILATMFIWWCSGRFLGYWETRRPELREARDGA